MNELDNYTFLLEVTPKRAPQDVPLTVRMEGCRPGDNVEIRVRAKDQAGIEWESKSAYSVNENGCLFLAPAHYRGPLTPVGDSMRLFWGMRPKDGKGREFADQGPEPIVCTLTAQVPGRTRASILVERLTRPPEETAGRVKIRETGLAANLFLPQAPGPHPGILVLMGSDGGLKEKTASLLAAHGFATLALAYFGKEGLPKNLAEIPLENVERAYGLLAGRPEVDGERMGIFGVSKGGELALILASDAPENLCAVCADSPTHVVWQGLAKGRPPKKSSWSRKGKGLPYVPLRISIGALYRFLVGRDVSLAGSYEKSLKNEEAVQKARIPVENISAPVLLMSGESDRLWPSGPMCEQMIPRLTSPGSHHVSHQGAGHLLRVPYLPSATENRRERILFGGTPEANAFAAEKAWMTMLAFFRKHLGVEPSPTEEPSSTPNSGGMGCWRFEP